MSHFRNSQLILAGLSALLLIVLQSVTSGAEDVVTLSDNDEGYRILGEIQRSVCSARPTHPCTGTSSECEALMNSLSKNIFPEDSDAEKKELEKIVTSFCHVRGTPYELLGTHSLLQMRFDSVTRIGREIGIKLPQKIVYGGLSAAGANAEVQVDSEIGEPIVLVNLPFLEFANEFSKLAAQTVPYRAVNNQLAFITGEDESRQKIASSQVLRQHLIDLIDYFYGRGKRGSLEPNEISKTVQVVYTEGIETFAIAHEVGHIYYGHPSSTFDLAALGGQLSKLLRLTKPTLATSIRELEADSFAIPIILRLRDDTTNDDKANPFFVSVLHAVEFYFIAQRIVDEAGQLSREVALPNAQPYSMGDVSKVAACALKPGCRARDIRDLSATLHDGTAHPPHQFREEVIRQVIKDRPPTKYQEWVEIAELTNRNARLLWELTKADYLAAHARPQ